MQNLCTKQLLRTTSTLVLHRQKNPSSKTDSINANIAYRSITHSRRGGIGVTSFG